MNKPEFIIQASVAAMQGLLTNEALRTALESSATRERITYPAHVARTATAHAEALWTDLASKGYVREK